MTAPAIPPTGHNPASPGQRQAARDHVTRLRQHGWTYRSIAAAAALSPNTVYALATGRRTSTTRHGHRRPHADQPGILSGSRLDAGGTRLRLRALHVMGHGSARIARAAGVHPQTIRKLVRGDARTVSPRLRDAIAGLYDAWWDKRAPGRTRFERAAATVARKRAIAGNWCAAAALDDDLLDIPGYRPQYGWKPATGTGTAPDIHPPALPQHKERHMTDDQRLTWGFILEVLDVLERHGYRRSDSEHPARPSGSSATWPGSTRAPWTLRAGRYVTVLVIPAGGTSRPDPHRPGRRHRLRPDRGHDPSAALDDAAEYSGTGRTCADCGRPVLPTCQQRLQAADTYDQIAGRMIHAAEASAARQTPGHRHRLRGRTRPPSRRPGSDRHRTTPGPSPGQPAGDGMKQHQDSEPRPRPGEQEAPGIRGRHRRQRLGQGALPGRRSQPLGRPAHRPRPPPRPRTRPGSRTMTPTRK